MFCRLRSLWKTDQKPSIFEVRREQRQHPQIEGRWISVSLSHIPLILGGRCAKYKGGLFNATLEAGVEFQGKPWKKTVSKLVVYNLLLMNQGEFDSQIFGVLFRAPDLHWHNMSRKGLKGTAHPRFHILYRNKTIFAHKLSPLLDTNRVTLPF